MRPLRIRNSRRFKELDPLRFGLLAEGRHGIFLQHNAHGKGPAYAVAGRPVLPMDYASLRRHWQDLGTKLRCFLIVVYHKLFANGRERQKPGSVNF